MKALKMIMQCDDVRPRQEEDILQIKVHYLFSNKEIVDKT